MVNNQENQLLESKQMREEVIGRIEVLEQVKELLLLGDSEFATTEMVAKYYGVPKQTVSSLVFDNLSEIEMNGYSVFKGIEILENDVISFKEFTRNRANYKFTLQDDTILSVGGKGIALFSKRAILNVGMLLRDSEVAKDIRSRLLDLTHDAQTDTASITTIVEEINEETILQRQLGEAYFKGDLDLVLITTTKINALKNSRIAQLEKDKEIIIHHATTITESRKVINRIMRVIGANTGVFNKVYNEFYSKINYQLGINLKARNKKPLDSMSEEEMFQSEIIARNWAMKLGLDVEKILSLN